MLSYKKLNLHRDYNSPGFVLSAFGVHVVVLGRRSQTKSGFKLATAATAIATATKTKRIITLIVMPRKLALGSEERQKWIVKKTLLVNLHAHTVARTVGWWDWNYKASHHEVFIQLKLKGSTCIYRERNGGGGGGGGVEIRATASKKKCRPLLA